MEIISIRQTKLDHYLFKDLKEVFQKSEVNIDDDNIINLIIAVSKLYEQYGPLSVVNLKRKIQMHRTNSKYCVIPSYLDIDGYFENLFVLVAFFKNKAKIRSIFLDKFFNSDIKNLKNIFYIGTLIDLTYFFNNIIHLIGPLTKKLNIRIHPIAFCGGRFSFIKYKNLLI